MLAFIPCIPYELFLDRDARARGPVFPSGTAPRNQGFSVAAPKRRQQRKQLVRFPRFESHLSLLLSLLLQHVATMRPIDYLVLLSTTLCSVVGTEAPRPRGVGPECRSARHLTTG